MKKYPRLLLGLLFFPTLVAPATAQREAKPREERREERRRALENMTPQQRRAYFENRWQERLKSATPQERERLTQWRAEREAQMLALMKEAGIDPQDPAAWEKLRSNPKFNPKFQDLMGNMGGYWQRGEQIRQAMIAAGITQKELQDPIVEFIFQQERERRSVLQLARDTASTLLRPVPQEAFEGAGTENAVIISEKLSAYLAAMEADKTRYEADLKALDGKVQYSKNSRLKAFLMLVGVINTDAFALGGPTEIFQAASDAREAGKTRGGEPSASSSE